MTIQQTTLLGLSQLSSLHLFPSHGNPLKTHYKRCSNYQKLYSQCEFHSLAVLFFVLKFKAWPWSDWGWFQWNDAGISNGRATFTAKVMEALDVLWRGFWIELGQGRKLWREGGCLLPAAQGHTNLLSPPPHLKHCLKIVKKNRLADLP